MNYFKILLALSLISNINLFCADKKEKFNPQKTAALQIDSSFKKLIISLGKQLDSKELITFDKRWDAEFFLRQKDDSGKITFEEKIGSMICYLCPKQKIAYINHFELAHLNLNEPIIKYLIEELKSSGCASILYIQLLKQYSDIIKHLNPQLLSTDAEGTSDFKIVL